MLLKASKLYNDYHFENVNRLILIFDCCMFLLVEMNIVKSEIICRLSRKISTKKLHFSFSFLMLGKRLLLVKLKKTNYTHQYIFVGQCAGVL